MKIRLALHSLLAAAALVATLIHPLSTGLAQGTAFTYQGRLNANGAPANGSYDVAFTLYSTNATGSAVAGPVTNTAVGVTAGLFTTLVDFGSAFTGASNWLQIAVSTNGANNFITLAPRQQVTPVPYAIYAESANAGNLVGTIPAGNLSGVALLAGGNAFNGTQIVTSGSVGINVANPVALFESRTPVDTRAAVFSGPDGGGWSTYKTAGSGNPYLWDFRGDTNGYAMSRSGIAVDFFMTYASGNLGLGTTSPSNKLDVQGSADFMGNVGIGTVAPAVQLDVNGDINSNGKSVPITEDKMRIVSGIVKGDGTIYQGSGWTVARTPGGNAVGDYVILFTSPFSDYVTVTVTPYTGAITTCIINGFANYGFHVQQFANGVFTDGAYFSFIAIGKR